MTQASTYADLIERVEKAEGPDRELDFAILSRVESPWMEDKVSRWSDIPYVDIDGREPDPDGIHWTNKERQTYTAHLPRYTASLDAAIALVEKVLPGNHWSVSRQCEHPSLAFRDHKFAAFVGDYGNPKRAEGPTPALALISALLRALQQGGGQ